MINIGLSVLIGFFLDCFIAASFVLHLLSNQAFLKEEKRIDLAKKKCEICGFFSFLNSQSGYWRCPSCESLNKG